MIGLFAVLVLADQGFRGFGVYQDSLGFLQVQGSASRISTTGTEARDLET